jgi:3-phosphoshikimate 1-carboxyvinyltransferase
MPTMRDPARCEQTEHPTGHAMPAATIETARNYPESIAIEPVASPVRGVARVPGSKSITNRALLIAGLAQGTSTLRGALYSDDTTYMAGALRGLGIEVIEDRAHETFVVHGGDGTFPASDADLFVGNSGTTMRFVTAALALGHGRFRIDGIPRMRQRPIAPLVSALRQLGTDVEFEDADGFPPVIVHGTGLAGGTASMEGDLSSQFFTGLLQAAPYASDGLTVRVIGDLVSKPYLAITADVMRAFGVEVTIDSDTWASFAVAPGQRYTGRDYLIEPDASNASYVFAAAAVTGGRVVVEGLGSGSHQGDLGFVLVLEAMGCDVEVTASRTVVAGPPNGALKGGTFDFQAISDTSQTLAAIAPFADGPVTFTGVAHNRVKETDRVSDLATELRRLGQDVEEFEDGLTIHPRPVRPASVRTYDDHRMAMSFAITGLRAPGVVIEHPACVAKTFPDFFQRLDTLLGR